MRGIQCYSLPHKLFNSLNSSNFILSDKTAEPAIVTQSRNLNDIALPLYVPVGVLVNGPGHLHVGRHRRRPVQFGEVIGHALERHLGQNTG